MTAKLVLGTQSAWRMETIYSSVHIMLPQDEVSWFCYLKELSLTLFDSGSALIFVSPPTFSPSAAPSMLPSQTPSNVPTQSPSITPSTRAPTTDAPSSPIGCRPEFGASINECLSRIKVCRDQRVLMKWSGEGCRKKGVALGDGGCQCTGYCGYRCKSACNRDKTCHWKQNRCYVKTTNEVGGPISVCPSLVALPG